MNKLPLFLLILLFSIFTTSCSSDDNSSNLSNVDIVFTTGGASKLELIPHGEYMDNKYVDQFKYEDVEKVSLVLPKQAEQFTLKIQGSQKVIKGYLKINGKTWEFNSPDWYYRGTYYLSDFK